MRCPTCDKELRALQVETMIGKPGFNEWCRNGYCSEECYARRDPSQASGGPEPVLTTPAAAAATASTTAAASAPAPPPPLPPAASSPSLPSRPKPLPRDPQCYGLAKFCFLAVPIYLGLAFIGNRGGLHKHPQLAFYYFLVLGGFILLAGLVSGIIALIAIREHGPRGLLWRSIIGILLILGFSSLAITSLLDAKTNPRPAREPATSPASR